MSSEMLSEPLIDLFKTKGTAIDVQMSYRILLHDVNSVFYIEEGDVDLFAMQPKSGDMYLANTFFESLARKTNTFLGDLIEGALIYLHNVASGNIIFPFTLGHPNGTYKVIALANTSIRLYKLPITDVFEFLEAFPAYKPSFLSQVNYWINGITGIFNNYLTKVTTYQLAPGTEISLEINETAVGTRYRHKENNDGVVWIHLVEGRFALLGLTEIILDGEALCYPLASFSWLRCLEAGRITAFDEKTIETHLPKIWSGLLFLGSTLLDIVAYVEKQKNAKEKERFARRVERDTLLLDETLKKMGSIFTKEEVITTFHSDKLLSACQLIGNAIDHNFIIPLESTAAKLEDRIYEIAVASNVNYRKVLLGRQWWKQDHGALLGFLRLDNKPVALLPTKSGKYELIDPADGSKRSLDATLGDTLDTKAYTFYRSLPNKKVITGKDVANFCLKDRSRDLWTIGIVSFIAIFLSLFLPFANQMLFDEVLPNLDYTLLKYLVWGLSIVAISSAILTMTREYAVLRLEGFFDHDLETALWQRLLQLPANFFRKHAVGNLIQRISGVGAITKAVSGQTIRIFLNTVFSFVYLLAMLYYSMTLTLVGVAVVSLNFFITIICFGITQKLERSRQDLSGIISGKIMQIIIGITKIRTSGVENRIFAFWAKHSILNRKKELQIGKIVNVAHVTNTLLSTFATLAIFATVMYMMGSSAGSITLSIGAFIAFTSAFTNFAAGFSDFSNTLMEVTFLNPMWKRSQVVLHQPPETTIGKTKPGILTGELRVEHLYFRYEPKTPLVHEDISLYALPGEFIGIVGPSGCGKSTLMRLLLGFETPMQGGIYYDGNDIAHLDLRELRGQMGVILQNSMIMDGTIRDNVTGGNIATDEQVVQALRTAGFEEDLKQLPMGIRTTLTTGGVTLSGGQRQRLLIARALLSNAKIIMLDEATNALDNNTQKIVSESLNKLNVTRIFIAHRLSTIRAADRIYVMDKGKIVDVGTFDALAARPGLFATLLERQTL